MIKGACHCGNVTWELSEKPETATACCCTLCRRYGALWAYEFDGQGIHTTGDTSCYTHGDRELGFHFCPGCGAVTWWRATGQDDEGRTPMAVNLRMAEPGDVADILIRHFNGLDWASLGSDGRCVRDLWF